MKHIMNKVCLALMLLIPCAAFANDSIDETIFVLEYSDGTDMQIAFSSKPELSFPEGQVCLKADNMEMTVLDMSDVEGFHFQTGVVGIDEITADQANIVIQYDGNGLLVIKECSSKDIISIYDVSGKSVGKVVAEGDGSAIVNLADYAHGVYIVNIANKRSIKLKY